LCSSLTGGTACGSGIGNVNGWPDSCSGGSGICVTGNRPRFLQFGIDPLTRPWTGIQPDININDYRPGGLISRLFFPEKKRKRRPDPCRIPKNGVGKREIDRLIKEAEALRKNSTSSNIGNQIFLARYSRTGQKWDVKNQKNSDGSFVYPNRRGARNSGNFLFGAQAQVLGIPWASVAADAYSLGTNGTLEDQDKQINAGKEYAKAGCHNK